MTMVPLCLGQRVADEASPDKCGQTVSIKRYQLMRDLLNILSVIVMAGPGGSSHHRHRLRG